jgi:hypothetical protein
MIVFVNHHSVSCLEAVIKLSFSLDEIPRDLLIQSSVYNLIDGTLRLEGSTGSTFQEDGVPLVELAGWMSDWLASSQGGRSFLPEGYDEDYSPMLHLTSVGVTYYRLTYAYAASPASWVADKREWEATFTQFIAGLRQAVQERYHVTLDKVLPPLPSF